jgi:cytochrome c553
MTRRTLLSLAAAVAVIAFVFAAPAQAARKEKAEAGTHTITGKSSCASCDGVTSGGHAIMLTDKKGLRYVLIGSSEAYRAAQAVRKDGKTMTATYEGKPVIKKDPKGKEYAQIEVTDIKVEG